MRRKLITIVSITTAISSLISAKQLISTLFSEDLYRKDFTQFFLMGHALRAHENLYSPLHDLAAKFEPQMTDWLRVAGYPPIVAVIGLPFSYLPYFWAVISWMVFELGCLVAAVVLIVRHFGGKSARTPVLITVGAFIGWQPIFLDLYHGQVMIPILLMLTLVWLALKAGKDVTAGLLLGVVISVKLYAWPIAIFLLLKRRWGALAAASVVFIATNVVMLAWVGSATLSDYYLRVGRSVLEEYKFYSLNFSAWCMGLRSFGLAGAVIMSASVLLLALFLALRSKDFDSGFMIMLTAAIVLQPISWTHYMVTLLPAFCFIADRREFRTSDLILSIFLILLIVPGFHHIAHNYAALAPWPPFLFIIGLMWLIVPKSVLERAAVPNLVTRESECDG
jgi:glycosyl transferase family 87